MGLQGSFCGPRHLLRGGEQVHRALVVRQGALEVLVLARQVREQHVDVCGQPTAAWFDQANAQRLVFKPRVGLVLQSRAVISYCGLKLRDALL